MEREERGKIEEIKGFKGVAVVRRYCSRWCGLMTRRSTGSGGQAPIAWNGPDMRVPHVSEREGERRARLLLGRYGAGSWAGLLGWPGWAFFFLFF